MSQEERPLGATSSWRVVRLLWKASRQRATGRRTKNQMLRQNKTGSRSNMAASWPFILFVLFAALMHYIGAVFVIQPIDVARQMAEERLAEILVVPPSRADKLELVAAAERRLVAANDDASRAVAQQALNQAGSDFARDASSSRRRLFGGEFIEIETEILKHLRERGSDGFVVKEMNDTLENSTDLPPAYWLYAMLLISCWFIALVFVGEGVELDIQKRRHPHWEWLLSHPIKPVAAFSAEFMAPMLVNPIYLTAPIFWLTIFRSVWPDGAIAIWASLVAGIAWAVAASCLNKSIEIAAMLRLPVRKRGYVLGLLSILSMVFLLIPLLFLKEKSVQAGMLDFFFSLPELFYLQFPAQLLLLGWGESVNGLQVIIVFLSTAILFIGIALVITSWGTAKGIQATETQTRLLSHQATVKGRGWIKNPHYRKELLWLARDKAAVVQVVLMPILLGGFQVMNMQSVTKRALDQWNMLGGLAIFCGAYFLITVGPRSLQSEGNALWIAQTWPKSLESLLKAKAKLWFCVSTLLVFALLILTLVLFPEQAWKILLLGIAWLLFGWGLAMKSVSVVSSPNSSGEIEKPSVGRKWLVFFGTFAFAGGVLAQSWHVATIGVVLTVISAAAMWQNLRARLPYLFDPWSERLPQAPTLMQSMIGIAIMVEVVGIALAVAAASSDPGNLWIAQTFVYGVVGCIAWLLMSDHLSQQGVLAKDIWHWDVSTRALTLPNSLFIALALGVLLAGIAYAYLDALRFLPVTREYMASLDVLELEYAGSIVWQIILVAGLVPFVEEYFFRGLLFRSLDREIGGWKAIIGSSVFFAIYHPPVSWVPVFLLGISCAWIFKRSGRLLPCVVIHMIYNLLIVTVVN